MDANREDDHRRARRLSIDSSNRVHELVNDGGRVLEVNNASGLWLRYVVAPSGWTGLAYTTDAAGASYALVQTLVPGCDCIHPYQLTRLRTNRGGTWHNLWSRTSFDWMLSASIRVRGTNVYFAGEIHTAGIYYYYNNGTATFHAQAAALGADGSNGECCWSQNGSPSLRIDSSGRAHLAYHAFSTTRNSNGIGTGSGARRACGAASRR